MEQGGVGGVEVLRPGVVVVGEVGVAAADEAEDLAVVDDREDDAVAEPVDQTAGAGPGGHPGGEHLVVGDAAAAEVVDQAGPPAGAWPGRNRGSSVEVLAEPVGEVVPGPTMPEPAAEVASASWLISTIRSG